MKTGQEERFMKLIRILVIAAGLAFGQDEKPRVFITDSASWAMDGGVARGGVTAAIGAAIGAAAGGAEGAATGAIAGGVSGAGSSGGARPQRAEIMKTFGERCPQVIVTINRERADFVLILDHEGGKGFFRKDNKTALFNKDGDMIHSGSTRSLGNAVKDACEAITKKR